MSTLKAFEFFNLLMILSTKSGDTGSREKGMAPSCIIYLNVCRGCLLCGGILCLIVLFSLYWYNSFCISAILEGIVTSAPSLESLAGFQIRTFFAQFSTFFRSIFLPNFRALGIVLRLGMVTTFLPRLWACWVWARRPQTQQALWALWAQTQTGST